MRGPRFLPVALALALLVGCRATPTPAPSPSLAPVAPPTARAAPPEITPTLVLPSAIGGADEGVVSAPPVVTLGGLARPGDLAWATRGAAQPLAHLLHRQLVRSLLGPTGEAQLAESWTMSGSRARFTLAEGAAWSDGRPLRAAEVAALLRAAAASGELPTLERATAPDERTVELVLAAPSCAALSDAATWPLVPDGAWPPDRTSGDGVAATGRDEWTIGDTLRYRAFPDEQSLRAAWAGEEIDGVVGANRLSLGALPGAGEDPDEGGPLLATLLFRLGDPLTGESGLREALTTATDRAALYEAAYGGPPPGLLRALMAPGHWAEPSAPLPGPDPRAAAQRLERLGWRDRDGDGVREDASGTPLGITLSLPMSADSRWERLGHVLAAQWAALGVDVELLYLEPFALQEQLHYGRWQVALLAYSVALDPDQSAMWGEGAEGDALAADLNVTGYANEAVASLMREGAALPGCAPEGRADLYRRAWAILLTERPLWPLFPLPLDVQLRPGLALPAAP